MRHHARHRQHGFRAVVAVGTITASILPALLIAPGAAHAESYRSWAISQAEACALPLLPDTPPINRIEVPEVKVMEALAANNCADLSKPVTDVNDLASGTAEVAQATAMSASPDDMIDVLAGTVTLQAASVTDVQYSLAIDATNPEVYVGAQSDMLGIGSGYAAGADTTTGAAATATTFLDPGTATGCLSGCSIPVAAPYLQKDDGPGSGDSGDGGNDLSRMKGFTHRNIRLDPAKNNNRADGYGQYFYIKATKKYRPDVDFYASSMWASAQSTGNNRLKKIYMSAIPGKSMEVVEAAPRGVTRNGSSIGSTTISATFSGEVKGGNEAAEVSGGRDISLSRTYERYEGSGGGGVLHDGTHYTTWIAGNKAGTTTNRSVDGVTTWMVPSGTAAHWDWQAFVGTCSNPCQNG